MVRYDGKDPDSLEELRDITPLTGRGLLHRVGSADIHYHLLRQYLNESIGGGEEGAYSRGGAYFKFWPIERSLI